MNRSLIITLIIMVTLPIFAMAKKPVKDTRPAWVDDPKSEYPDGMYLSAIGSAGSRADAENAAMGNLAKIFRSDVNATTTYQERYNELMTNTSATATTETNSQKNVKVKSKQSLMNIEIGKSWTDKLGQTYVIAYINRLKTADIYEQQIEENSAQIRSYLEQAAQETDSWKVYAFYSAASLINAKNDELLGQLAIISSISRQALDLGYSPKDLKQHMAEQAKSICFTLNITGDIDGKVKAVISEVLTSYGFTITEREGTPFDVNMTFEDVELNQPQKFVRYTMALNVYDENGSVILTMTDNSREGHINKAEAQARAIRTLSTKIKTTLPKRLNQHFDGMVIAQK